MDDTLHLNSSKAVALQWVSASLWFEFIFYVNLRSRVIPELLEWNIARILFLHMHKKFFFNFGEGVLRFAKKRTVFVMLWNS